MAANEKYREVYQWLEEVYGGERVPQYEVNERTIEILYGLMQRNRRRNKHSALELDDVKQKSHEYNAEVSRISAILQQVGMPLQSLSDSGVASLQILARLSILLETKDASNSSLMVALSAMRQEDVTSSRQLAAEEVEMKQLTAKVSSVLGTSQSLQTAVQGLDDKAQQSAVDVQQRVSQTAFFQKKARDYQGNLQRLQGELSKHHVDSSLYHKNLQKSSEFLKELKEKLHRLQTKIDSYHKLPPSMDLAQVKVEEARRELMALDDELAKYIDVMHT